MDFGSSVSGAAVLGNGDGWTATVTAVAEGTARITATAAGFPLVFGVCDVTVEKVVTHTTLATFGNFCMGIKEDGGLYAWGSGWRGRLGLGDESDRLVPTLVESGWASVACGQSHTAAIKADGSLWTWGWNNSGQLCLGDFGANAGRLVPTRVGEDTDWESVAVGNEHNVAIKTDGSLWAWGNTQYGQCGIGYVTPFRVTAPQRVGEGNDWTSVSAGYDWNLALKSDGSLWVWGRNLEGYLGLGDSGDETNRNVPTRLGTANDWAAVAGGQGQSMAIKTNGSLWAWGSNWGGQLGDGTFEPKESPVQVGTGYAGAALAGGWHTAAVKSDGSLWTWGYNGAGGLGLGDTDDRNIPERVGTANDWAVVALSADWSLALKTDGSLWTWGYGADGQLGDGIYHFSPILEPVQVDTGYRVPGN